TTVIFLQRTFTSLVHAHAGRTQTVLRQSGLCADKIGHGNTTLGFLFKKKAPVGILSVGIYFPGVTTLEVITPFTFKVALCLDFIKCRLAKRPDGLLSFRIALR
ncbi:MAG TPA: hypothetical protein DCW74_09155, partial [Alteromonas australica]|nr:hypothetical protein [Alteromonas australica]